MPFALHDNPSALRRQVARDPWMNRAALQILAKADAILDMPPVVHSLDRTGTLLTVAREFSRRIQTLGVSWLVSGNRRFQRRIVDELIAAAKFPSWNWAHFLDTAEMMAAVSIGRSWIQSIVKPQEDDRIVDALIRQGVTPARNAFKYPSWWVSANHNWTVVCAGGSILGALSAQDAAPELAREVLQRAKQTLTAALKTYEPDGGWPEGPTYWAYATDYAVLALGALEASGDHDIEIPEALLATWRFGRAMTSPAGSLFDYGDSVLIPDRCLGLGWLALRSGDAGAAAWQREAPGEPRPFDLFFGARQETPDDRGEYVEHFVSAGVSTMAAGDLWLGIKGGSNAVNHAHLDLGTVVLEFAKERFLSELGREDYALPGYFDPGRRFGYFRTRTEAHNTIAFRAANQAVAATATCLGSREPHSLSAAYRVDDPDAPCRFSRAVEIVAGVGAIIADRVVPTGPSLVEADWLAHTAATVNFRDGFPSFSLGETTIEVTAAASFDVEFRVEAVPSPPGQSDNSMYRRLRIPFLVQDTPAILTTFLTIDPARRSRLVEQGAALQAWLAERCP